MSIRLGEDAPDFTAETTEGTIRFHEWIGDHWAILFSPSEGFHARMHDRTRLHGRFKPEFDKRNTKIIGLSIDPVSDHRKWWRISPKRRGMRSTIR